MYLVGLYLNMAGMVNSPKHAMQKKEVTMHVKMATSLGSFMFITAWNFSRMCIERGAHLGHLVESGISLCVPFNIAQGSSLISHFTIAHVVYAML